MSCNLVRLLTWERHDIPHPSRRRQRTPLAIALAPPWGCARQAYEPNPADLRFDAGMLLPSVSTTA